MLEPSFSLLKCSHGFLRELILGDILAFELKDFFLELFFLLSDQVEPVHLMILIEMIFKLNADLILKLPLGFIKNLSIL